MTNLTAPILGKPILPSLTQEQVLMLIEKASCVRDKAIIALFAESGLRLSELANLRTGDIDWQNRTIKTLGKGNNEDADTFSLILNKFK
jgi:integrase